jgi:hypothetical protein
MRERRFRAGGLGSIPKGRERKGIHRGAAAGISVLLIADSPGSGKKTTHAQDSYCEPTECPIKGMFLF